MKRKLKRIQDTADKMIETFKSSQDPNGSYTGTPFDYERPVQDADDL
ncbi:MAG: hypothetical protein FWG51_05870 [Firmicutes bacterium]|nr:hypothetical protein [Bacillota bacterium]